MEVKSVLNEFRKSRKLLENLRENAANPRLKGMWKFLNSKAELVSIIYKVPTIEHLVAKAGPNKPIDAATYDEIVGVGIYIMRKCSESNDHVNLIINHLGLGLKSTNKNENQTYVNELMGGFIYPALDFIEDKLEELVTTESKQKSTESDSSKVAVESQKEKKAKALKIGRMKQEVKTSGKARGTTEEVYMSHSCVRDVAAVEDTLGFTPYVEAVADFLTEPRTEAPLTLSIEGEWGSGKSSFMLQLEKKLEAKGGLIVKFSPWRHDNEDSVWAAFALEFIRQLAKQLKRTKRFKTSMSLLWKRFSWKDGWFDILKLIALLGIWVVGVLAVIVILLIRWDELPEAVNNIFIRLASMFGAIYFAGLSFKKLKDLFGSPLDVDIKKYMKAPDYVSRISFIEQFHKDFKRIVRTYAGTKKVYVFIDDLDRCQIPKASDLMQSINLMISDDPQLIFIIGMDREKIAAGLAAKHEKVVEYLEFEDLGFEADEEAPSVELPKNEDYKGIRGLRYGYSFIEKFIQLPFFVPQPSKDSINRFIAKMNKQSDGEPEKISLIMRMVSWSKKFLRREDDQKITPDIDEAHEDETKEQANGIKQHDPLRVITGNDSEKICNIIHMVAGVFDYNPRRIKNFTNVFRLRAHIADKTGLFRPPVTRTRKTARLTLEKLGKFVAISTQWPELIGAIERDPDILEKLSKIAEGNVKGVKGIRNPRIRRWRKENKLLDLIKYGCSDDDKQDDYTLLNLSVQKLLQVSPAVSRIKPIPKEDLTSTQKEYKDFYSDLLYRIKEKHPEIKRQKPLLQSWLTLPIGHGYIHLEWAFHGRPRSWFEVGLHFEKSSLEKNRQFHDYFLDVKKDLEGELGGLELTFECPWRTKWARIYASKQGGEMTDELKDWAVETALKFYDVFKPRLDKFIRSKKGGRV